MNLIHEAIKEIFTHGISIIVNGTMSESLFEYFKENIEQDYVSIEVDYCYGWVFNVKEIKINFGVFNTSKSVEWNERFEPSVFVTLYYDGSWDMEISHV